MGPRNHAATLQPDELRGIELGRQADVEAAVAGQQHGPLTVLRQISSVHEKHRHGRAVLRGIPDVVHRVGRRVGRRRASRVEALEGAEARGDYLLALTDIAGLQPYVAKYFDDVMVMAEDAALRDTRLQVMAGLRDMVVRIADISEIVAE